MLLVRWDKIGFRNNNPDKGTETYQMLLVRWDKIGFRNNNPDKGTETRLKTWQ